MQMGTPTRETVTPSEAAARASAAMHANDAAAQALGMEVTHVDTGAATVTCDVQPHMVNGHDICHGGYIFLLADTAMAHASNSHNINAVASAASTGAAQSTSHAV